MNIGGVWVGWGIGDIDPKVAEMKAFLRRKFSYAQRLDDAQVYDQALADVVAEMQGRYRLPVTGVMNWATQVRCGFIPGGDQEAAKPTLFTASGTGVPWWVGPDADLARAVEHKYRWQPVGYRAAPFPMWPSISEGREELVRLIGQFPGPFALAGYSQGAVVAGQVWKWDILHSRGRLHHRLKDVRAAVTFGDPMRQQGIVDDDGLGTARPESAGIMEDRHTETPDWWKTYAHKGDLYTDVELDDEGEYKRAICKIVMGHNVLTGSDSILAQVLELAARPMVEGIAMLKAITDAGLFFIRRTGPHINYQIGPATDHLLAA